jgi:hypothetical protein
LNKSKSFTIGSAVIPIVQKSKKKECGLINCPQISANYIWILEHSLDSYNLPHPSIKNIALKMDVTSKPELTIFIPVYDEYPNIDVLCSSLFKVLVEVDRSF